MFAATSRDVYETFFFLVFQENWQFGVKVATRCPLMWLGGSCRLGRRFRTLVEVEGGIVERRFEMGYD